MRIRKIVVGLTALAAVTGIAACSSGANAGSAKLDMAAATSSAATTPSTSDQTTSVAPVTSSTTTAPSTTPTPSTTTPVAKAPTAEQVAVKPPAAPAPAVSQTPCAAAARACVDLSAHEAWLVQNGKIVYGPVSIMPGRPGYRTPVGTFHVQFKDANFYSTEFHAPMPYSVFFVGGVAFHEGSLSVYSHGCVHLSQSSAITFFHSLSVGDEVQVVS